MTRKEFIEELEWLLSDLPESDREDAITYYEDYFEEAGPEREAEVIAKFRSPQHIANMIKEGLEYEEDDWGQYTENGYQDIREAEYSKLPVDLKSRYRKKRNGKLPTAFWVLLLIFSSPIWLSILAGIGTGIFGLLGGIIGIIFGILGTIIGLGAAVVGLAIAGVVSGIVLILNGIIILVQEPAKAVFVIGVGSLLIAGAVLCAILSVWIFAKGVPMMWRWIKRIWNWFRQLCQKIFRDIGREV